MLQVISAPRSRSSSLWPALRPRVSTTSSRLGVLVKDADLGLLDFPALRSGAPVLLCWHVGEDAVAFWHSYEEGFAGRKPIDWGEEEEH